MIPARSGLPGWPRASLAALALWLSLACGGNAQPGAPRLVLLYAPCTVNKAYLSPYDTSIPFTPHLAGFAREAVVFRRHQTEAGQSGIAYASLFSGAQADRHGAFRHPVRLADDLYLVAEAYADRGFETFFWNGHAMGGPNYGQGVPPENLARVGLVASDPRFQALLGRLRSDPDARAFVMTNFTVTHSPYRIETLAGFARRHPEQAVDVLDRKLQRLARLHHENHLGLAFSYPDTVARLGLSPVEEKRLQEVVELLYRANVYDLDQRFGAVVDTIREHGLLDQSLIAFTADHGELVEPREELPFRWSHAMQLAPDVLSVPLLVRSPDPSVAPGAYEGVTRSIDVYPTLAGLSGFALPDDRGIQGVDLSPALRGEAEAPSLRAFSHTTILVRSVFKRMHQPQRARDWALVRRFYPDERPEHMWVGVREGDRLTRSRKLADGGWRFEAVDLEVAPSARGAPEVAPEGPLLRGYKDRLVRAYEAEEGGERLLPSDEEARALRELGYIR